MLLEKEYKGIIAEYKSWRLANPDTWLSFCFQQKELEDCIKYAAMARNHLNKKNNHQRRLKNLDLQNFYEKLIDVKQNIAKSTSFEDLLNVITSCKVKGIGELAIYDTAYRIGHKLDLSPEYIYLHAGTKIGAKRILGKIKKKKITIDDLPNVFKMQQLKCSEVEEILCIYKDQF